MSRTFFCIPQKAFCIQKEDFGAPKKITLVFCIPKKKTFEPPQSHIPVPQAGRTHVGPSVQPQVEGATLGCRWHQVAGRRISTSRGQFGVDGVNCVFGPRMQRPHDEHQIQTRHWRLHVRKSPVWKRHWLPWGIIRVQKWTLSAVRCRRRSTLHTNGHGTVGSHQRVHQTVTAPHPEVGSRTRSRNGASEFSVPETGTIARADRHSSRCRCASSSIRFGERVGKVEGQSRPVGSQSHHKSSSQRISGSCRSWEDQGRQTQGVGCDDVAFPMTHKIWSCGTQTTWESWGQSHIC